MFRVGDEVKIFKGCKRNYCHDGCNFINKIGNIEKIDNDHGRITVKFKSTDRYCSGFDFDCFKLISKEIKQFGIVKFCATYYK
jgi:hypothetical protein